MLHGENIEIALKVFTIYLEYMASNVHVMNTLFSETGHVFLIYMKIFPPIEYNLVV